MLFSHHQLIFFTYFQVTYLNVVPTLICYLLVCVTYFKAIWSVGTCFFPLLLFFTQFLVTYLNAIWSMGKQVKHAKQEQVTHGKQATCKQVTLDKQVTCKQVTSNKVRFSLLRKRRHKYSLAKYNQNTAKLKCYLLVCYLCPAIYTNVDRPR